MLLRVTLGDALMDVRCRCDGLGDAANPLRRDLLSGDVAVTMDCFAATARSWDMRETSTSVASWARLIFRSISSCSTVNCMQTHTHQHHGACTRFHDGDV